MASTKKLDRILDQIDDDALRTQVAEAFADLSQQRKFGLVFEEHVNESVRLPGHKIKVGSRVVEHRSLNSEPRRVVKFTDHTKTTAVLDDGTEHPVTDLCVLSGLNDSFYPGFTVNEVVINGPADARTHAVIKGENYHVLKTLAATHKGKVDLIYIDPPYNTGNDSWIYNDKYVAGDDLGSSSKWLSFMQRRLLVAKELLKDTGVIFVAIGDAEHHRLRMLMDQIFGAKNFLANITWQGSVKSDSRYGGGGVDYMIAFARDRASLDALDVRWKEGKKGLDEVFAAADECWGLGILDALDAGSYEGALGRTPDNSRAYSSWHEEWNTLRVLPRALSGSRLGISVRDHAEGELRDRALLRAHEDEIRVSAAQFATKRFRDWWRKTKPDVDPGTKMYNEIDERGRVFQRGDLRKPEPTGSSRYDLLHPVTGRPVRMHPNGWVFSQETMAQKIVDGHVIFGPDETTSPRQKRYLADMSLQVPKNIIEQERSRGSKNLARVLGDRRFPFPKDHEVLMRWIRMAAPKDALILDFFGGSGSTAEAVIRLNAEDGGTRQCVLVTNNEVGPKQAKQFTKDGLAPGDSEWEAKGVYEYVTRPRIKTVVTGVREDGSVYSEGLAANVAFLSLEYLDKGRVKAKAEYKAVAPLLWLWAGGVGPIINEIDPAGYAVTDQYGVLFDVDQAAGFVASVSQYEPRLVFVVTDSLDVFAQVEKALPHGTVAHRLYSDYLENFEFTETE